MGTTGKNDKVYTHLQGMAAEILQEVIRADMSMHAAQLEAWQWMAQHLPKGELINDDLHEGIARNLYLALSDLNLTFYVRARKLDLRQRARVVWRALFGKAPLYQSPVLSLELCAPSDEEAMKMEIKVSRFKNGTVKMSYGPADEQTADLMKKIA